LEGSPEDDERGERLWVAKEAKGERGVDARLGRWLGEEMGVWSCFEGLGEVGQDALEPVPVATGGGLSEGFICAQKGFFSWRAIFSIRL